MQAQSRTPPWRAERWLPWVAVLLPPFILLAPVWAAGKALFWGTPALQFVPWWTWSWETLLNGQFPLWNPDLGMGAPLLANYQSALFYPPTWIYFILYQIAGVPGLAWGQAVLVGLHLAWAGLGMLFLTRQLGLSRLAQGLAGLSFCLSGHLVARAWFASVNSALAWLPWLLYLGLRLATQARRRDIFWLAAALGMQLLAGHAQTTWYSGLLLVAWITFCTWQTAVGKQIAYRLRAIGQAWLRLALAGSGGLALAAVQLFPTAEYLLQSQRSAAVEFEIAMTYSFWPWRFLGLLVPDLFGSPVRGDYWGYAAYWEDAIYIGLLPFLLALGAGLSYLLSLLRRRAPSGQRLSPAGQPATWPALPGFLLLVLLTAILLGLGQNLPIFPWLYRYVPTFAMFQAPTRWLIWGVWALSLLAALGLERWRRPQGRGLYWTRLGTAGAFSVTAGAGLALFLMSDLKLTFIRATALAGLWALGAGLLSLTAAPHGKPRTPRWQLAVVFWVGLDLLVAGWGLNPGIDLDFYRPPWPSNSQIQAEPGMGRLYLPRAEEDRLKYERYLRFDSFDPFQAQPGSWEDLLQLPLANLNLLTGVPMVNNYDPLLPGRYVNWLAAFEAADPALQEIALDLMAVSLLAQPDPANADEILYLERPSAARLRFAACADFVADPEQALARVFSGQVDFNARVVLERPAPAEQAACLPGMAVVQWLEDDPGRITIGVSAEQPGWVVLSDTWYPGWQVWVDGQPGESIPANYAFRAIPVAAGDHQISLQYRPLSFTLGVGISLLALLVGVGSLLRHVIIARMPASFVPDPNATAESISPASHPARELLPGGRLADQRASDQRSSDQNL